ncbi:MAG: helix-turn-helix domain-containing protein [Actinomycetota bacterium]|nr:helix-turn-helix domain-containing protein [Actinomycetota bacterium]
MNPFKERREQKVLEALAEHGPLTDPQIAERVGVTGDHAADRVSDYTAHLARRGMIEPQDGGRWKLRAGWSPLEAAAPEPKQPPEFSPW